MSKLDLYVKLGSKLALVAFLLILVHAFSGILSSFGIVSDLFTVAGAIMFARIISSPYVRRDFLNEVDEVVDIDEFVFEVKEFLDNLNIDLNFKKEDEEEFDFDAFTDEERVVVPPVDTEPTPFPADDFEIVEEDEDEEDGQLVY